MSTITVGRVFKWLALTLLLTIAGLVAWGSYLVWDFKRWDARVDELCKANGGRDVEARIYETVEAPLTKEYFATLDPPKSFFIPERSAGKDLGSQYPFVRETRVVEVLKQSRNLNVIKYTERIVRVIDSKILGERFLYQRAGNGLPGPEVEEIRICPVITTERRLDVLVFVNHPRHIPRK